MFSPVVEMATTDIVNIKKLKDFTYKPNRKLQIPKSIKPLAVIPNYKKIPFTDIYTASKYVANTISPKLRKNLVLMNKKGSIYDEEMDNEFDCILDEIHIDNTYTPSDVLSVMHEMGHAICLTDDITREIPSITTEFLADKILQEYNIPTSLYMTVKKSRIKDMLEESDAVDYMTDLLEEFEKNDRRMTPKIADEFCVGSSGLDALQDAMEIEIPYFIGSAGSLVLADNIRDSKDYDDAISILSNTRIGKVTRLKELNITPKTLEEAFGKNIQ
jgi:hypothetical protein